MKRILLTFALLLFAASNAKACELNFQVSNAWAQPTLGSDRSTIVHLDLKNIGDEMRTLTSLSSPSGMAELYSMSMKNGVTKMRTLDSLDIKAGETAHFTAEGNHIMLTQLKKPLKAGDKVKLTLYFDEDATLNITVPVSATPKTGAVKVRHHHQG